MPACHLYKLKFSSQIISNSDQDWSQYLQQLGITSKQGIKLLTEAGLLGSAIEHGLSPKLIVLSDGAKQFALLVHALCWIHMEPSLRRLNGMTAQHRREIEQVQDALWSYYHQLKAYQLQPTPHQRENRSISTRSYSSQSDSFCPYLRPSVVFSLSIAFHL